MTKEKRMPIYNKFGGHCAYCGTKIDYKDMQVDHIVSKRFSEYMCNKEMNNMENLNPSCRQCNRYKMANEIEIFREMLTTLHVRLEKIFIYRLAKKYGIVKENVWDGKFYFEREEKK